MMAIAPTMNPYIHLPVSVLADVTGSVAMKTAPKQKPPRMSCSHHSIDEAPVAWKMAPMTDPPTNTLSMVFQLAMPVQSRMTAPMAMAMTEVSPMQPGMNPVTMSQTEASKGVP